MYGEILMKQITTLFLVIILVFTGTVVAPTLMMATNDTEVDPSQQPVAVPETELEQEPTSEVDTSSIDIGSDDEQSGVSSRASSQSRAPHYEASDFPEANVYYMVAESIDSLAGGRYLDGIPLKSDGRDTKLNKANLHLPDANAAPDPDGYDVGNRMYFRFPRSTGQRFDANYNSSFMSDPFINITFNTLVSAGKEVNIEVLIDADGDFNTNSPDMSKIEGIIEFPTYTTVRPSPSDEVQMEETYEANGTWGIAGFIPQQIRDGAIYLSLWRTDNIFDPEFPFLPDLLVYAGFTNKTSWMALPYEHTVALPHANASYDFVKDQVHKWYGIWEPPSKGVPYDDVQEWMKMKPYDSITFNASRSYDVNDDLNSNQNIDDGIPAGEIPMADESDTLQYKWYFGDGTNSGWGASPMVVHKYTMDATIREKNYTVDLQIRNRAFHIVTDSCSIRIFNEEHQPEIQWISVLPESVDPYFPDYKGPRAVINQEVRFSGYAIDRDPWDLNDLRYEWDLDGDLVVDVKEQIAITKYTVSKTYSITLWVYDGEVGNASTLFDSDTASLFISNNDPPEAMITAHRHGDEPEMKTISAKYEEPILFNATNAFDPDNLPGFDTNKDFVQDHNLSFRWHWNWERENQSVAAGIDPYSDETIISEWTFNITTEHKFTSSDYIPGSNYRIMVFMEADDGETIVKSDVFVVTLDLQPIADFYINNKTELTPLDHQPGVGEKIHFDASLSYDPNDDLNNDGIILSPEVDRLTYSWSFDDGTFASGKVLSHAFAEIGDHSITLSVSDGEHTSSKVRHVFVQQANLPPIIVMEVSPNAGPTHFQFSFKSSDSSDPDLNDDVVKFHWDFGDGGESAEADTTHAYTKEGAYRIVLTVTDRRGAISTNSDYSLYIYNREPNVAINMKSEGTVKSPVKMSATASDADGSIEGYYWDFGDDEFEAWGNLTSVSHTYDEIGSYTVTVTVQDDKGKTNISSGVIKIITEPVNPEIDDNQGISSGVIFWLIIVIVVAVIAIAIVAVIWRIRKEAL
jgi:PKD repeat protein